MVASNYQNPILKEAIHTFKYRRIKSLSFPLASLIYKELVKFFKSLESPKITAPSYSNWLLVPVPATDKKIKHRGFNQAEELARRLHEIFEIPLKTDIIRKCRPTTAQIKTKDAKTRRTNLKKAFSLHPNLAKVQLIGRRVLLVDDVTTTGTTLEECAKVLSPLVYEIWGVTIAK